MCQTSLRSDKLTVVKKDLIVWKVVIVDMSSTIKSSWQGFKYKLGKTYQIKLGDIISGNQVDTSFSHFHDGYHSFKYRTHAEQEAKEYGESVVKCITPKGARVIKGTYSLTGNTIPTFVSNKIRLVEIV